MKMCELNVIFHENGEKKVLMEDVVKIKSTGKMSR
jgi:predicted RNA-binding protein